jgi:hypothetical protein
LIFVVLVVVALAAAAQSFGAFGGGVTPQDDFANGGAAVTDLNSGTTAGALAQSLAGSGVSISNVTYTGNFRAAGSFTGGAGSIGFDSGVVLSSGAVETQTGDPACAFGVEGPNSCHEDESSDGMAGTAGTADSTGFNLPGDPDLDALVAAGGSTETTEDASVLQFDFVPTSSAISFRYVFGSEEYDDFVGQFDDVFGFFVNGANCATVPGTTEPVSVNTINDGNDTDPSVAQSNPQLFRDNVNPSPSLNTQMDGLTTVLTCRASVNPGVVNHLKLAIADTGDDEFDSAVFIQAASLSTQIVASGGQAFAGPAPYTLSGTVANFTDSTPGATPASYTSTINWGDGSPATAGAISGAAGSFAVTGSHTYSTPGTYTVTTTVAEASDPTDSSSATDTVTVTPSQTHGLPTVMRSKPTVKGTSTAAFSGAVDPNGSATTAHFEYGLDPKYNGGGPVVYDQSTPSTSVGSDFASHQITAAATGLVPNAEYHVRLVATNSQGTAVGPDATFTTRQDPAPPPPVLGQTENLMPVTGLVFIKLPHGKSSGNALRADAKGLTKGQGYIPLTEARQVPVGTSIDSRRGTLSLVAASGHGHGHSEQTHTARVGGAVFGFAQSRSPLTKGLTTFTLKDNAFHGAPSFNACKANASLLKRLPTADAIALKKRVNSTVVQTLNASDHGGKYKTNGRYSASTVRGTVYSVSDRCDGTLTTVKRGSISVLDFQTRKTIIVRAGHSYLARAVKADHHTHKKKHHKKKNK